MRLKELVKIDARFEKAINLLLDLGNPEKVRLYIPTHSSINILKGMIGNVNEQTGGRANILIGPYGKGKSHLLLVLLALLNGKKNKESDELLKRIKTVDEEAYELIKKVYTRKKLLPVIVNTSSGNLSQALIKSLNSALKKHGLTDVVPDNYFSEALRTVEQWKNLYPDTFNALKKHVGNTDRFIEDLKEYDHAALDEFRRLHPLLTSGSEFNPVIDDEAITVYSSVNRILCEKYGFNGIYLVFDEFSKYIEGHTEEGFSADMKVLQDMCELCNSSKDEQVHLTCVAHKAIRAYGDRLPAKTKNAFRGVEGRLDEILFTVSSQNNYELISDAIQKTAQFSSFSKDASFNALLDRSYQIPEFNSLFGKKDFDKIIGYGSFPLTPLSSLLLLNLSEKIAQNERTIFTFLTGKDTHSLATFVKKQEDARYAGADLIYDYFSSLIEEDKTTSVHSEWVKAEYALSKTENDNERKVIKAVSVIRMMNNADDLPTSTEFITLSLGTDENIIKEATDSLQKKGLITYRNKTGSFEFSNGVSVNLEKEAEYCAKKYYARADVYPVLNSINHNKSILPKRYNQDHLMTRYYNMHIMSSEAYLSLSSVSYIEKDNEPDGFVLVVNYKEDAELPRLKEHLGEIGDETLVAGFVKMDGDISREARMYLASERLLSDDAFTAENAAGITELIALKNELSEQMNEYIGAMVNALTEVYTGTGVIRTDRNGLNRAVSDVCEKVYDRTPVINQELINRHNISAQMSKARNTLLDDIFHARLLEPYETGSSAESTIYRAAFIHTKGDKNLEAVRNIIREFIHEAKGKKIPFKPLISTLTSHPIGMRKGILPLYLAEALMELEDMPVVYLNKKEIGLDASLITNIVASPDNYSLYVEVETGEKLEYVEGLETMFAEYGPYCKEIENRNRLLRAKCYIQAWYRGLPQSALVFTVPEHDGQDIKKISAFRKLFMGEPNPRDMIFEQFPQILGGKTLLKTLEAVREMKEELDSHVVRLKKEAEKTVRKALSLSDTDDFILSVRHYLKNLPEKATASVLPMTSQRLLSCLSNETASSESLLEDLSKAATNLYIEDWNDSSMGELESALDTFVDDIKKAEESVSSGQTNIIAAGDTSDARYYAYDPENISVSGHFFKSALDDMLEEYGESVENSEKIGILMDIVKKLMR